MKIRFLLGTLAALGSLVPTGQADEIGPPNAAPEQPNTKAAGLEASAAVPAADGPAIVSSALAKRRPGAAFIKWQGYVRAIGGYIGAHEGFDGDQSHSYHPSRSELAMRFQIEAIAKSDTAGGEIGASIKLRSDYSVSSRSASSLPADLRFKEAFGWWSPNRHWTISGGYTKSLGNMDYGLDNYGPCTCYFIGRGTASDLRQDDVAQLGLTRNDGPLSGAISLQSAVPEDKFGNAFSSTSNQIALAASWQWNDKSFDAGVRGYFAPLRDGILGAESEYQFGIGFDADVANFAKISVGAAAGRENIFVSDCDLFSATFEPTRYYAVSGLLTIKLSDTMRVEAGYALKYYKQSCHNYLPAQDAAAGIYYQPIRNLTLGVEGEWIPFNGGPTDLFISGPSRDETRVAFVSKFRF